jgi:anti-sigma factor RsiW
MSRRGSGNDTRRETALHAYHDGELRGLARWRFERRLARSPALRRELEMLAQMRELLIEADGRTPAPDLWAGIAQRLPAVDARREEAEAERRGRGMLAPLLKPVGAVAAVAAVAIGIRLALPPGDGAVPGVVRWIDTGPRNVIVLEDEEMTVIWVLDSPPGDVSMGGARGFI